MTSKEYNDKIKKLFLKMKPINEQFLELEKLNVKGYCDTTETRECIYKCVKPYLEADAIRFGREN